MRSLRSVVIALLVLIPGVASAADLVVWHAYRGGEKAAFEKVVENYNALNKGTKVSAVAVPYDPFADRITAAVPKGKGPDVFIYAQDRLGGWIASGNTVVPLEGLDASISNRYLPGMMQAMTFQGKVYGLPLNFKTITMVYNKKLIAQPPRTSTELLATMKKLTDAKNGQYALAYWYSNFYYHAALLNPFVKQAGGGVFNSARKPTIDTTASQQSMDVLLKWMDYLPPDPSSSLVKSLFNSGKAAMVFEGPWFLGEIDKNIDYALAPLPVLDEASSPMRPWITIEGAYIAAPSTNKAAALEFIKYLTDTPAGLVLATEGRQTPANKGVYGDPRVANDPILKAFRQQVGTAIAMPNVPEMSKVWTPATNAMTAITKKTAKPKDALAKAQKEVEAAIAGK